MGCVFIQIVPNRQSANATSNLQSPYSRIRIWFVFSVQALLPNSNWSEYNPNPRVFPWVCCIRPIQIWFTLSAQAPFALFEYIRSTLNTVNKAGYSNMPIRSFVSATLLRTVRYKSLIDVHVPSCLKTLVVLCCTATTNCFRQNNCYGSAVSFHRFEKEDWKPFSSYKPNCIVSGKSNFASHINLYTTSGWSDLEFPSQKQSLTPRKQISYRSLF